MNKNYYLKYIKYRTKYLYLKKILSGGLKKKKIILYSISANPPTFSHLEIIEELSKSYDHVVVWISINPNKIDPSHKDYDPMYLSLEKRIMMFEPCLQELNLPNVVFDQEYNDIYSGVSICKYIRYNLIKTSYSDSLSIEGKELPFKKFLVKSDKRDNLVEKAYELWICFGKDVVADIPNWTYNNLFLPLATGIIMKTRVDDKDYSDHRYSFFTNYASKTINKDNNTYFVMPCIKDFTKDKILETINEDCYQENQEYFSGIDYSKDGPLCIIEKKQFQNVKKNYSSTSVRNLMIALHLTMTDKNKIESKILEMVPLSVYTMMIDLNFYNITDTFDELKKEKILKRLGLPINSSDEQIIFKIYEIEKIL